MANTGEIPFGKYYGTIDATPLFVMLAGMYYQRTADKDTITDIWPNIKLALHWIDTYGDLDGDGFVEYIHKAENGLTNQGWKDSYDSVMYENGDLCETPIALCEVQGYVYGAKKYAALLAKVFESAEESNKLNAEAEGLKSKFNEQFWDSELGCYVLALDRNKKPCRVVSSNAGQCLFTGIVEDDKVRMLADTLMSKNMFSGWGVRTLSADEKRYNPMSYHNGSIWPHDNALIAYGLSLYGYQNEALRIMDAMFDASLYIELQRLPELYCGFDRKSNEGPTAYPVACSPQAWSVAVLFMLIQSCLQIHIDALAKTIVFDKPELPEYLDRIHVENLMLGAYSITFDVYKHQYDVGFNVEQKPKEWEVIIKK
jgi:glycogen debranching enzyme